MHLAVAPTWARVKVKTWKPQLSLMEPLASLLPGPEGSVSLDKGVARVLKSSPTPLFAAAQPDLSHL